MSAVEEQLADALAAWAQQRVPEGEPAPAHLLALARTGVVGDEHDHSLDVLDDDDPDAPGAAVVPLARWRSGLVLLAVAATAALLVLGAVVGARALRPQRVDPALRVGHLLSVFDRPATRADRLPATVLDAAGADYVRSRYLGATTLASVVSGPTGTRLPSAPAPSGSVHVEFWAAVQGDGQICLVTQVTVPDGGSTTGCETRSRFAAHGVSGASMGLDPTPSRPTAPYWSRDLSSFLLPDSGRGRRARQREDGRAAHRVAPDVYASLSVTAVSP